MKEEEGIERFDSALSKMDEWDKQITTSKDLSDLTSLIDKTNK